MPVAPTYPGVYIQELPSGVHAITGVATSIGAFVDFFPRGPLNEAVQVFSFADVERIFGGLHLRSEASYALDQFFRNGGSSAWVVRVSSAVTPARAAVATAQNKIGGGAVDTVTFNASDPGLWGNNVRVRVDPNAAGTFDVIAREVQVDNGRETVLREIRYSGLSMTANDPRFISTVINDAADNAGGLIRVTAVGAGGPPPMSSGYTGPVTLPLPAMITGAGPKALGVTLQGAGPNDPRTLDLGNAGLPALEDLAQALQGALRAAQPSTPAFAAGRAEFAQATVRIAGTQIQVVPGVGSAPYARFVFADTTVVGLTAAMGLGTAANGNVAAYALGTVTAGGAQTANATANGLDGDLPLAVDLIGSEAVTPPTGMFALNQADLFNLLCLPRVAKTSAANGTDVFPAAQVDFTVSGATDYCVRRRAILLLDPPDDVITPVQMRTYIVAKATQRHQNLALHYPRLIISDPENGFRDRSIGPSGTIAGLCSRIDTERGVWKAPAGTEASLRGVSRLESKLSDAENGTLNPIAVNCLRTFDLYGNVSWGARTLFGEDARASEWKYLPVRRLALYLEETLFRSTQWVIFEPNDEPLWAQIRLAVGSFMNDLFHKGAFAGRTKQEAYFVHCDASTTTPLDRERGIVNLVVGFAPLKPAEFLVISITQIPPTLEV